jgi:hypothetical protein
MIEVHHDCMKSVLLNWKRRISDYTVFDGHEFCTEFCHFTKIPLFPSRYIFTFPYISSCRLYSSPTPINVDFVSLHPRTSYREHISSLSDSSHGEVAMRRSCILMLYLAIAPVATGQSVPNDLLMRCIEPKPVLLANCCHVSSS